MAAAADCVKTVATSLLAKYSSPVAHIYVSTMKIGCWTPMTH
jgi:hypothetical protein